MWGRKRRANRRGHQRYTLLNVDLPIEKVRQQRLRWAFRVVGFVFGVFLIFMCVWHGGSWLMKAGFYQNDRFTVRIIDIRTSGLINPEQIRSWARIHEGENLFGMDLQRIKRDLEMVPQIKVAAVDRVLPKTLRLRVTERRPLAQVVAYKQYSEGRVQKYVYWLDAEGVVMPSVDRKQATGQASVKWMPLIIGLNQADLMPGRPIQSQQLESALSLIKRFDLSPMAGLAHLRQIDISHRETLKVETWRGGQVTLSLNGIDRQLKRWRQLYDLGRKHNRAIFSVDLSIKNNLPVRWRPSARLSPRS